MLKKIIHIKKAIFSFILLLFFVIPANAQSNEKINTFATSIIIQEDGVVKVTESIEYDFGTNYKHGIFRDLQYKFTNSQGKRFEIDVEITDVELYKGSLMDSALDDALKLVPFEILDNGDYVRAKIGDPNSTITGVNSYIIKYNVSGALESFEDYDELFWNVLGTNNNVPILESFATVVLPESVNITNSLCYTGEVGSTDSNCTIKLAEQSNAVGFTTTQQTLPGQDFTISVQFPKNSVPIIPKQEIAPDWFSRMLIIIGAVIYFLFLPIVMIILYFVFGRDPKISKKSIPVLFEPPKDNNGNKLKPAEVGVIVDEKFDNKDLTATIVDLAIRGYIKIEEKDSSAIKRVFTGHEFIFKKSQKFKEKNSEPLKDYEQVLYNSFFKNRDFVESTDLKTSFYKDYKSIKDIVYTSLFANGFFPYNPEKVRQKWLIFGIIACFFFNPIAGFVSILISQHMVKKTTQGVEAKFNGMGLKKFLSSQEQQLEFMEDRWHMFEKLLPYAIVFGVTKTWAQRFADLQIEQELDWYSGNNNLNTIAFANGLSNLGSNTSSFSASPQSSSGFSGGSGGFSGGGFSGGGGTGSW